MVRIFFSVREFIALTRPITNVVHMHVGLGLVTLHSHCPDLRERGYTDLFNMPLLIMTPRQAVSCQTQLFFACFNIYNMTVSVIICSFVPHIHVHVDCSIV